MPIALNRVPMPFGAMRRATPASISPAFAGFAAHQPRCAFDDPEPAEEFGLRDGAVDERIPPAVAALRQLGEEIDLGGQIGLAGRGQRVLEGVPADGLQRVAGRMDRM